jgi:hypothetical protein
MGSSAAVVVVGLGLLMAVRWLSCQSRTGDGERTVGEFWPEMEKAQWSGWLVSGRRNWRTARDERRPELEERRRTNVGRRWRTTVGRK